MELNLMVFNQQSPIDINAVDASHGLNLRPEVESQSRIRSAPPHATERSKRSI